MSVSLSLSLRTNYKLVVLLYIHFEQESQRCMEMEYLNVLYKSGTVFNVYGFVVVNNINGIWFIYLEKENNHKMLMNFMWWRTRTYYEKNLHLILFFTFLPTDYNKIPQLNCILIMFIYLYFYRKIRPTKKNERNEKMKKNSVCDFTIFLFFPYNWKLIYFLFHLLRNA